MSGFNYLADMLAAGEASKDTKNLPSDPWEFGLDYMRGTTMPSVCPKVLKATVKFRHSSNPDGEPLSVSIRGHSGTRTLNLHDDPSKPGEVTYWHRGWSVAIELLPIEGLEHDPHLSVLRSFPTLRADLETIQEKLAESLLTHRVDHDRRPRRHDYNRWASRNRFDDPDMGAILLDIPEGEDFVLKYLSNSKMLVFAVLDAVISQEFETIRRHLARALQYDLLRDFMDELTRFREATDVIARFELQLLGIHQRSIRQRPDGRSDDAKAVDLLAKFLKKEVALPDASKEELLPIAADISTILIARRLAILPDPSGIGFECEVSERLIELGYSVEPTARTGDFGVDLVAEKDGLLYAIQCKGHGVPVGIKAVQEASAGRRVYKCDFAGVVSITGFTKAAEELASENAVLLVTVDHLARLEALARIAG